mmetsp:Transcript_24177/g.75973  ORF Transcript_24177/g.75973 Transcript_24177/m.75973 type:complete len:247 (-) Transcript_24177:1011-1751(-)
MPAHGPKKRDTKSYPGVSVARAVAMTPRPPALESSVRSGVRPLTALSLGSSTTRSSRAGLCPTHDPSTPSALLRMPRRASPAGSSSTGAGGNSSWMPSPPACLAKREPLRRDRNSIGWAGSTNPPAMRWCAAARVACPQRSTSTVGVNQRRLYTAPPAPATGARKAVSERFISRATSLIHSSSGYPSLRRTTAAGLPPNALSEKASTVVKSTVGGGGGLASAIERRRGGGVAAVPRAGVGRERAGM